MVVSACMSGTCGSCVLSSTGDVLEMSVVRGVGEVCDMCMCLALDSVGGVWIRAGRGSEDWDLPILEEQGEVGYVSVFWLRCAGGVGAEWVSGLFQGLGGWCGVKSVFVVSLDYLC